MSLLLRAQYEYIPDDVLRLSNEDAKEAIPERFRDQMMLDDAPVLYFVSEEEFDDENAGKNGVEWVLQDPVLQEPTNHRDSGGTAAGNGEELLSGRDGGAPAGNGRGGADSSRLT